MRVLVVSTYDLGRPPIEAHALTAALGKQHHHVSLHDLAVDPWPGESIAVADALVICVPMHTASRLAVAAITRFRDERAKPCRVVAFGLYARLAGPLLDDAVDAAFGPQELDALCSWIGAPDVAFDSAVGSTATGTAVPVAFPSLSKYARLVVPETGVEQLAGAASSSSGCVHRCRHCPVPVAFEGRVRLTNVQEVIDSIDVQVEAGARHVSFTDPDFLNAPGHARRVVEKLHARHPHVSLDCTVKVEHILRHRDLWPEMAASGCLFVISAVECVDDAVLNILDKGHTAEEAVEAVHVLRAAGIDMRPSLLPFTPWTTLESVADLFDFVLDHDLIGSVDPVHYGIRLLVPRGSLLEGHAAMVPHIRGYDDAAMAWSWVPMHPETDELQARLSTIAQAAADVEEPVEQTYAQMRAAVFASLGRVDSALDRLGRPVRRGPHMSEAWFCCAEPTGGQLGMVACSPAPSTN